VINPADPWVSFRQRWRPYYIAIALWVASLAMLGSDRLFHVWQKIAIPLFILMGVLYWRITRLVCPRCHQPFYWPAKLVWRQCVHCGLKQYASPDSTPPGGA
jgi:hypothetical protein